MWHSSYGEMAAQQLDEWRRAAGQQRMASAAAPTPRRRRASVRITVGRALVKLGERLAGGSARPAMR